MAGPPLFRVPAGIGLIGLPAVPAIRRSQFVGGAVMSGLLACAGAGAVLGLRARADRVPFDEVALRDQFGRPRRLREWRGSPVVLDFVFTGCGDVCPSKTQQLVRIRQALAPAARSAIRFVSVSIDPLQDDPPAMLAYAERNGADLEGWSFLTGGVDAIAAVGAAFDAGVGPADVPDHVVTVRLLDPSGAVARRYDMEPLDEPAVARDADALCRDV